PSPQSPLTRHHSPVTSSGRRNRTFIASFKARQPTVSRPPILQNQAEGEGVEPSSHCCSAVFGTAAIALWLALPISSLVIRHSRMTNDPSVGSLGFEPRPSQIKSLERCRLRHDPKNIGDRGNVYDACS